MIDNCPDIYAVHRALGMEFADTPIVLEYMVCTICSMEKRSIHLRARNTH